MQGFCFRLTIYLKCVWYHGDRNEIVTQLGVIFLNTKHLLGPIVIRYLFFAVNFYFTIHLVANGGWGFFPVILASFAARDFVQATQLAQIYYKLTKNIDKKE